MGSRPNGRHRNRDAVSGLHDDPMAVAMCRAAGVGGRLRLRIGGKPGPRSGPQLDFDIVVRALAETHGQTSVGGQRKPLGEAAFAAAPYQTLTSLSALAKAWKNWSASLREVATIRRLPSAASLPPISALAS